MEAAAINPETAGQLDYIGLAAVRSDLARVLEDIQMQKKELAAGVKNINPYKRILVFQGNKGTGKTTVADAFTKELLKSECLETKVVVTKRATEIRAFLEDGANEAGMKKYLKESKPGALIIDNAVEDTDFLHEIFQALIYGEQNCICILLGLKERFDEYFKKQKEDEQRVSKFFNFPDQSSEELAWILEKKFAEMNYTLEEKAKFLLPDFVNEQRHDPNCQHINGWLVENVCVQKIREARWKRWNEAGCPSGDIVVTDKDVPLVNRPKTVEEILAELDGFVGLKEVKDTVRELAETVKMQMKRQREGKQGEIPAVHYIFAGNPGTGKTVVARKLGEIFKAMKLLESGHVVDTDRSGLVAEYVGQTAPKVQAMCDKATGGILLIDEAYALRRDDSDTFGQEAIDTLLKRMEDDRGKFVVIAAGYSEPMKQWIQSNPGLPSRFTKVINFADYNADELFAIFSSMVKKGGYKLADDAAEKAKAAAKDIFDNRGKDFANGRNMRQLYENCVRRLGLRLMQLPEDQQTDEAMSLFTADDIAYEKPKELTKEDIYKELDNMIGLASVKTAVKELEKNIAFKKKREEEVAAKTGKKPKPVAVHFVFTGNPGTGKTTVARILGQLFKSIGLLSRGHVIDTDRSGLVAEYLGQTSPKTIAKCEEAMGGILLIDEAYTLTGSEPGQKDQFGQEAIDALLKKMEDDRGKFVVIAAGYKENMDAFINSNPGLRSRFTHFIHLDDYNPEELFEMYKKMLESSLYVLDAKAEEKAKKAIEEVHRARNKTFANGREMRTFFEKTERCLANRVENMKEEEYTPEASSLVLAEDIPWEEPPKVSPEEVLAELNKMTGLTAVKLAMEELTNTISAQVERRKMGLKGKDQEVHFVFTGSPGTGKTTVARMLGKLFMAMGLLPTDKVVEVDRSGLVAQFVGQTAPKVNAMCDKAIGGILFIDEAYSLCRDDSDTFGKEAVDVLLKRMEDDRGKYVVIAAGYAKNMDEWLQTNPGLPSRFTKTLHLEDYTPEELYEIFSKNAKSQDYHLTEKAEEVAKAAIEDMYRSRGRDWANARTVREFLNNVIRKQSTRVASLNEEKRAQQETWQTILPEDIPFKIKEEPKFEDIIKGLDEMTGLAEVKDAIKEICADISAKKKRQKPGEESKLTPVHFLFMGNPGTGKTTVARKMGALFKAIGVIPTDRVLETSRSDYVAPYVGQTAPLVNKTCDKAEGGILFIDEAYSLCQGGNDQFGQEAVATLIQRIENDRGKYIVIAAGYEKEMRDFLATNSGFASRFSHELHLADYKPDELYEIFAKMAKAEKFTLAEEAQEAAKKAFTTMYENRKADFANGRSVRNFYEATVRRFGLRINKLEEEGMELTDEILSTIAAEDIS
jgi:SpoVK/Ycf46/Vps4 family AAA+-type ATPase